MTYMGGGTLRVSCIEHGCPNSQDIVIVFSFCFNLRWGNREFQILIL